MVITPPHASCHHSSKIFQWRGPQTDKKITEPLLANRYRDKASACHPHLFAADLQWTSRILVSSLLRCRSEGFVPLQTNSLPFCSREGDKRRVDWVWPLRMTSCSTKRMHNMNSVIGLHTLTLRELWTSYSNAAGQLWEKSWWIIVVNVCCEFGRSLIGNRVSFTWM